MTWGVRRVTIRLAIPPFTLTAAIVHTRLSRELAGRIVWPLNTGHGAAAEFRPLPRGPGCGRAGEQAGAERAGPGAVSILPGRIAAGGAAVIAAGSLRANQPSTQTNSKAVPKPRPLDSGR